eukprot:6964518-Ditylum_brightwellii.AAC.1
MATFTALKTACTGSSAPSANPESPMRSPAGAAIKAAVLPSKYILLERCQPNPTLQMLNQLHYLVLVQSQTALVLHLTLFFRKQRAR